MALTVFRHVLDPDDDGTDAISRLVVAEIPAPRQPADLADASPWVDPDYGTIADQRELVGTGPFRDAPGPPLVMPAGLLPDGNPAGANVTDDARRIIGVLPPDDEEANAIVWAYWGQQRLLRFELGLPPAKRRPPTFEMQDTPETLAAIAEIHRRERATRLRRAG